MGADIGAGNERVEAERVRARIEYWKQVIYVETHFNDMCIRTRWVGLTVIATILAGAAVALTQYPHALISVLGVNTHIGVVLILMSSFVAAALWLLDAQYYYQMLLATVGHARFVENRLRRDVGNLFEKAGSGPKRALTGIIESRVSKNHADAIVHFLYGSLCLGPLALAALVQLGASQSHLDAADETTAHPAQVGIIIHNVEPSGASETGN